MQISRLHHPVTALGHGIRVGIWTQGCSIHCEGCVSLDTLEPRPDRDVPVSRMLQWISSLPTKLDGVTVSGGEPTDQPAELRTLLEGLREVGQHRGETWDLMAYTGRSRTAALHRFPWLTELVDVLVTGPFVMRSPTTDPLKGSANQEIVILSALGWERYGAREAESGAIETQGPAVTTSEDARPVVRRFDVAVSGGTVWMVGIPRRGDMERLRRDLARHGVLIGSPSWLA